MKLLVDDASILSFIKDYFHGFSSLDSVVKKERTKIQKLQFMHLCSLSKDITECYKNFIAEVNAPDRGAFFEPFPSKFDKINRILSVLHHTQTDTEGTCEMCSEVFKSTPFTGEMRIFVALVLYSNANEFKPDQFIVNLFNHLGNMSDTLIKSIIYCFPERYEEIVLGVHDHSLECMVSNQDLEYKRARYIILLIISTNKCSNLFLIEKCIKTQSSVDLLLTLILDEYGESDKCFISIMNRLLIFEESSVRDWFSGYIKQLQSTQDPLLSLLTEKLASIVKTFMDKVDSQLYLATENISGAISVLQTIAALRAYCNLEFDGHLSPYVFQLITVNTSVNEKAVHFIKFSICFFIAMRQFLITENAAPLEVNPGTLIGDGDVISWIQKLIQNQTKYNENAGVHSSYSELLLLLSTLFQVNSSAAISETVNSIVGVKFTSIGRVIGVNRKLFTQNLFNERLITSQVALVPTTEYLSDKMTGYLPIHCVLPLLQSNAFLKSNVNISDWIFNQLCFSIKPVHPLIPDMIDHYVESITSPMVNKRYDLVSEDGSSSNVPCKYINEEDIIALFNENTYEELGIVRLKSFSNKKLVLKDVTPQLLLLYYLLGLYDAQLKLRISGKIKKCSKNHFYYPENIFDIIPVKYLLTYARKYFSAYQCLYPKLLHLVVSHLPHLITGELVIQDELLDFQSKADDTFSLQDVDEFQVKDDACFAHISDLVDKLITQRTVSDTCVISVGKYLKFLCQKSDTSIMKKINFIAFKLPKLLCSNKEAANNKYLCQYFIDLWRKIHLLMPRKVQVLTINALRGSHNSNKSITWDIKNIDVSANQSKLIYDDIVTDPVENVLMYVDRFVYRSPPLLSILLRIVECCLLASRSYWLHRLVNKKSSQPVSTEEHVQDNSNNARNKLSDSTMSKDECERLRLALVVSQDAAVVQILLEFCLLTKSAASNTQVSIMREIQQIICTFIHYLFITEPCLANVVHWQTYPTSLLEVATESIPSMHIILDYAIEVFRISSDYQKMAFFLNLLSHLSVYYNIRPTLERTTFILDSIKYVLMNIVCSEERYLFVVSCLDGFTRLAESFPILAPKISDFLLSVAIMFKNNSFATGDVEVDDMFSFNCLSESLQNKVCYKETMKAYQSVLRQNLSMKNIFIKRICQ